MSDDDDRHRRQIAQRLSLRGPQERSLGILARLVAAIEFTKDLDPAAALREVQALYPSVTDFEREFPSICFAIATGVGKTRLMGAFISLLFLTGRSKNFFVLAPNTTIYEKLVADFSRQTSPKYVFRGISQFAQGAADHRHGRYLGGRTGRARLRSLRRRRNHQHLQRSEGDG